MRLTNIKPVTCDDFEDFPEVKHSVIDCPDKSGGLFCEELQEDERESWARIPLSIPVYNPSAFPEMAQALQMSPRALTKLVLEDGMEFDRYVQEQGLCFLKYKLSHWLVTPRAMRNVETALKNKTDRSNTYQQILRVNDWVHTDPTEYFKQRRLLQLLVYRDSWDTKQIEDQPSSVVSRLSKKEGLVRGALSGKRVDFSGRSVIVPDPLLDVDQVGLPDKMAMELLRPHLIGELKRREVPNPKRHIRERTETAKKVLAEIAPKHWVMVNRAPSLHRYSIQLGRIRVDFGSKLLKLNPLTFSPCAADADGDTMAVHLVLSTQALEDALEKMHPAQNLLSSADGSPIYSPSHEAIVGLYARTMNYETCRDTRAFVRRLDGVLGHPIPRNLFPLDKTNLKTLLTLLYDMANERDRQAREDILKAVNELNRIGYEESTKVGVTLSMSDLRI